MGQVDHLLKMLKVLHGPRQEQQQLGAPVDILLWNTLQPLTEFVPLLGVHDVVAVTGKELRGELEVGMERLLDGVLEEALAFQPGATPLMELPDLTGGVSPLELMAEEVPEQVMVPEPLARVVERDQEHVRPCHQFDEGDSVHNAGFDRMAEIPETSLDPALWHFEILLAHALGYTPELSRCVVCGKEPSAGMSFAPSGGGMVCAGCAASEPGAARMSEGAAAALTSLPTWSERTDEAPESRPEPELAGDLTPYVRDEIGEMLVRFLGEHAGRELRLKSLDFLAQIRRAELASGESE